MRFTATLFVLGALAGTHARQQQCVTEAGVQAGVAAKTVIRPAQTVTLVQATQAPAAVRTAGAQRVAAPLDAVPTITRTAKPVVATTTVFVTTGGPGGTTTITSYTLNVPQPSLAKPVLQRRRQPEPDRLPAEERKAGASHAVHTDNTGKSNGVDNALFSPGDENPNAPEDGHLPRVYCHDVVTKTVAAPASSPSVTARAVLGERQAGTVTVTVTPTKSVVTITSSVPAPPTATAIVGGYDVCNPNKFSRLYDWTAYQAQAVAFGIRSFPSITDPGACCAAAANVPGALAWAVCDGTNNFHASCADRTLGPCFVSFLKDDRASGTTAAAQCVPDSVTSSFQYRRGTGQVGGPLQCASTYEPYTCVRPVLLLLGDLICFKS